MCPSILIFRLKIFYIKKRVEKACIFSFCKVRALKCGLLGDLKDPATKICLFATRHGNSSFAFFHEKVLTFINRNRIHQLFCL
jgi:hypothetical protein